MSDHSFTNSNDEYQDVPDYEDQLFPGFEKKNRLLLLDVLTYLYNGATYTSNVRHVLLFVLVVFNILHLVVLTRKNMRNNAINIMLASMAINDILMTASITSIYVIGAQETEEEEEEPTYRSSPDQADVPKYQLISMIIGNVFKRNMYSFPILMAATRALAIKNFDNPKYSVLTTGKFGLLSTIFLFLTSSSIAVFLFFHLTVGNEESSDPSRLFRVNINYLAVHDEITSLTNHIIPIVCYPIFTFILVRELFKARKKTLSANRDNGKDRTTKLVITMTVCFLIAEIPQGIGTCLSIFNGSNAGIALIGRCFIDIFYTFSVLNSTSHCLICYKMSAAYKEEFDKLYCRKKMQSKTVPTDEQLEMTTNKENTPGTKDSD